MPQILACPPDRPRRKKALSLLKPSKRARMGFCSYYCGSCVASHCCPGFHSHHHAHYGCAYFHSHFGCCSGGCHGHGCHGSCCSRFGKIDYQNNPQIFILFDFRAAASHYRHLEHYHRSLAAAYHHSADDALRCHPC